MKLGKHGLVWVLVLGWAVGGTIEAARPWVVSSSQGASCQTFQTRLAAALGARAAGLRVFDADALPRTPPPGLQRIVGVGVDASERVAARAGSVPVLAVRASRQGNLDGGERRLGDAGPVLGVHASPDHFARQTVGSILGLDPRPAVGFPTPAHPRYCNVPHPFGGARSPGFVLPPVAHLRAALERLS